MLKSRKVNVLTWGDDVPGPNIGNISPFWFVPLLPPDRTEIVVT